MIEIFRFGVLAVLFVGATGLGAAEFNVAVVNLTRVSEQSLQVRAASAALEKEFETRRRELVALDREIGFLKSTPSAAKDSELTTEISAKEEELRKGEADWARELDARRKLEGRRFQESVKTAMREVAQVQGFDIVLVDGVGYVSPRADLTDRVIEWMNSEYRQSASP